MPRTKVPRLVSRRRAPVPRALTPPPEKAVAAGVAGIGTGLRAIGKTLMKEEEARAAEARAERKRLAAKLEREAEKEAAELEAAQKKFKKAQEAAAVTQGFNQLVKGYQELSVEEGRQPIGMTERIQEGSRALREEALSGMPSAEAALTLGSRIDTYLTQRFGPTLQAENRALRANHIASVDESFELAKIEGMRNWQNPEEALASFEPDLAAYFASYPGTPEQREKVQTAYVRQYFNVIGDKMLDEAPGLLRDELDAGVWDVRLPAEDLLKLNSAVDQALSRRSTTERAELNSRIANDKAQITMTGTADHGLPAQIAAFAGDPAAGVRYARKQNVMLNLHDITEQLKTTPLAEAEELLEKLKPAVGDQDYAIKAEAWQSAARHFLQNVSSPFLKDPAGYAEANNPEATTEYWLSHGAEDESTAREMAVSTSLEFQRHLGLPEQDLKVEPQGRARAMVSTVENLPPADVAPYLDQLADTYGPHYPRLFAQLVDEKLPRRVKLLAVAETAAQRQDLASAFEIGEAALKVAVGEDSKGRKDILDIGDGVRAQLRNFYMTIRARGLIPEDTKHYTDVFSSITELAYYYKSRGKSVSEAAEKAAAVINGKYEYRGEGMLWRGENTFRVPREFDADMVEDFADGVREKFIKHLTEPPRVRLVIPGDDEGFLQEYVELITDNSYWVTNHDETGLELRVEHADGAIEPVRYIDHEDQVRQVELRFHDAAVPELEAEFAYEGAEDPRFLEKFDSWFQKALDKVR